MLQQSKYNGPDRLACNQQKLQHDIACLAQNFDRGLHGVRSGFQSVIGTLSDSLPSV